MEDPQQAIRSHDAECLAGGRRRQRGHCGTSRTADDAHRHGTHRPAQVGSRLEHEGCHLQRRGFQHHHRTGQSAAGTQPLPLHHPARNGTETLADDLFPPRAGVLQEAARELHLHGISHRDSCHGHLPFHGQAMAQEDAETEPGSIRQRHLPQGTFHGIGSI